MNKTRVKPFYGNSGIENEFIVVILDNDLFIFDRKKKQQQWLLKISND